jgi:putative ABC transport system ATP-binding protein
VSDPFSPTVVRAIDIHKIVRLGTVETPVLQGLSLDLRADRFAVLCGACGNGRTTVLNLLGGFERPDRGRIVLGGEELQGLSEAALSDLRRDRIGFVFQQSNLLPDLSVLQNIEYPLALQGVGPSARAARALQALEEVGLAGQRHHRPGQLSATQRQRAAVALALVKRPLLVLADEPTADLDPASAHKLLALLRHLQRRHRVALLVSSDDPKVRAEADDTIVLQDGRRAG